MTDKILVLATAGSKDEAHKIARALVERLLAACVNIVPQVRSVYRWEGEIEEAEEWLLIVKTTQAAFERVRDAIVELHSYDVPECISVSIDGGSVGYLSSKPSRSAAAAGGKRSSSWRSQRTATRRRSPAQRPPDSTSTS